MVMSCSSTEQLQCRVLISVVLTSMSIERRPKPKSLPSTPGPAASSKGNGDALPGLAIQPTLSFLCHSPLMRTSHQLSHVGFKQC